MDAQLKKGVLEMCLLSLVSRKEQYGYDIIRQMQVHFPEMGESSFYAILRRLHRDGNLEQYIGDTSGGPPRKYYRITPQGLSLLEHQRKDWNELAGIVREMLDE